MSLTEGADILTKPLTAKQEAFCLSYVECGNASEAYRRSYNCKPDAKPEPIHVNACKLMASAKVALRVRELQAKAAESAEITLLDIARMLKEDRQLAHGKDDAKAAVEATMSLAKLLGHYTETKHVKSDNRNHNVEERLQPGAEWVQGLLGTKDQAPNPGTRPN